MHCVINPTFAIFSQRKLTYHGPVYMNPNSFEAANLFAGFASLDRALYNS